MSIRDIADFAVALLCSRISVTRRMYKVSVSPDIVPGGFKDVIDRLDYYMSVGVPSIKQQKLMRLSV